MTQTLKRKVKGAPIVAINATISWVPRSNLPT